MKCFCLWQVLQELGLPTGSDSKSVSGDGAEESQSSDAPGAGSTTSDDVITDFSKENEINDTIA